MAGSTNAPTSKLQIVLAVSGLLVFGALNTLTTKIQYTLKSEGTNGEPKLFKKPFMVTFTMFVGMAAVLIPHFVLEDSARRRGMQKGELLLPMTPKLSEWRSFCLVGIPATFDLLSCGLMFCGMIYITASIWQMLRGSMLIFTALLSVSPVLGRRLLCHNWVGVTCCAGGILLVGASNILNSAGASAGHSTDGLFGMGLVLSAQVIVACQIVAEEKLLKELSLPGMKIVGYEGVWGCLLCVCVVFPLCWVLPGQDNGHFEDVFDTFLMIRNSPSLHALVWLYVFSCATYNVSGMAVTSSLSAVHRTMLEASRTMAIWLVDLGVHYFIDSGVGFGEAWLPYSGLQLLGFFVLIGGQSVYGGVIELPCRRCKPPRTVLSPVQRWESPSSVLSPMGLPPAIEDKSGELLYVED